MVVHMQSPVGDGRGTAYPFRPRLKGVVWERDGDKLRGGVRRPDHFVVPNPDGDGDPGRLVSWWTGEVVVSGVDSPRDVDDRVNDWWVARGGPYVRGGMW